MIEDEDFTEEEIKEQFISAYYKLMKICGEDEAKNWLLKQLQKHE